MPNQQIKLNLRKLQHIAGLSLQNGIRLHFDSLYLYKQKSFPTALFISVIAMEEIGKAFWADHFVFHSKIDGRADASFEAEWIQMLFGDHKGKQLSFMRQVFHKTDRRFYAFVDSKQLDILKQNSIYVGLQKPKQGQARTKGRIINPIKIDKPKAKKQIDLIHNFLTAEVEDSHNGIIYHDLAIFRKTFNQKLLNRLSRAAIK